MSNAQAERHPCPRIALSRSAIKKLIDDPSLRAKKADRRLPILLYFHRVYSTSHDGVIIEHGDGFSLTSIDPNDQKEMEGTVCASVKVADGLDILVGASASIMPGSFTIGWSRWRFTYEPHDPS